MVAEDTEGSTETGAVKRTRSGSGFGFNSANNFRYSSIFDLFFFESEFGFCDSVADFSGFSAFLSPGDDGDFLSDFDGLASFRLFERGRDLLS